MYKYILLSVIGLGLIACQPSSEEKPSFIASEVQSIIAAKMDAQESAWNEGDLDGFMSAYWESDSLSFIGSRGLNRGWQTTLDNYKRSYSTPEEMGELQFRNDIVDLIDANTAQVIGSWTLYRTADTLSGYYSLIWQTRAGEWVIISDHSS